MRLSGRLGVLQEVHFRRLWLGQTTSTLGDSLIYVGLPFAVIQIGGGAAELGFVFAAYTLARASFILVGGVWADRLPRRLVMLTCDVVRAAVNAFVAVALLTDSMEVWMFVVTSTVFGAAQAFFSPASTGLVPQVVSEGRLQQANAMLQLSNTATNIFGPALSGLLIAVTEPAWVFAADSVSFVVSAAFLARLRARPVEPGPRQHFFADLRDGAREAWSHVWLRVGFLAAGVANVGIGILFVLGPLVAEEDLGGAAAWGLILTGGAIGGFLGSVVALRWRPARPVPMCLVAWSFGALPLLFLVPPLPALMIAAGNAAFSGGIFFGNAVWETLQQREIPPQRLSRVNAFDWMFSLCFMPVGQASAGPLADAVGIEAVLIGAALLIAVPCLSVLPLRGVRDGPRLLTPLPSPAFDSAGESPVPAPLDPLP